MSDADLEFPQSRGQHGLRRHGDDLGIRVRAGGADQFGPHLCILLQSSLQTGVVYKTFSYIAQTDRMIHILKIAAGGSCDRRREVRTQNQRISFSVKKLKKISGGNSPDIGPEYIKKFDGGRLDIPVSIGSRNLMQPLLQDLFSFALIGIDVAESFRCMKNLLIHI